MASISLKRVRLGSALALAAVAVPLAVACGSPPTEPSIPAVPEPEPVVYSTCPDTPDAPAGAPFVISYVWCAQDYLENDSGAIRGAVESGIEDRVADFNQTVNLETDDIVMVELTFDAADTTDHEDVHLTGEDSSFKLHHKDGTVSIADGPWLEVTTPLEELNEAGGSFLGDIFNELAIDFILATRVADESVPHTGPVPKDRDVRAWVSIIFPIANPVESLSYDGTSIPLTFSPIEE